MKSSFIFKKENFHSKYAKERSRDGFRPIVKETWNSSMHLEFLVKRMNTTLSKCQAVTNTKERVPTKQLRNAFLRGKIR